MVVNHDHMMNFSPDPKLIKELKKIIREDLEFPYGSGWTTKTIRDGNMVLYINKKLEMLVKAPMCLIGEETPGITLPTIQLGFGWVLQPLCTFENRSAAYKELAHKIGPDPWKKFDFHIANVARFRGVPVMFDW